MAFEVEFFPIMDFELIDLRGDHIIYYILGYDEGTETAYLNVKARNPSSSKYDKTKQEVFMASLIAIEKRNGENLLNQIAAIMEKEESFIPYRLFLLMAIANYS